MYSVDHQSIFIWAIVMGHFISLSRQAVKAESGFRRASWIPIAWFAGLLFLSYAVVLYRLAEQWLTNDDMSHGIFVPLLVGYIVWQRRKSLAATPARPNVGGLGLMLIGLLFLCIGPPSLPTFTFMTRLAFLLSLVGLILLLRGAQSLTQLAYPLLLLLFMIPLPAYIYDRITLPLQFVASALAEWMLELLGYSVLREGNILHLPGQTLSVVEACSGLRSLLSLSFLGQAYIYLFDSKPWMRIAIAFVIVPIAVVANGIRILVSAILGEHNRAWGQGMVHESTGWVVFVIAFVCLLLAHVAINRIYQLRTVRSSPNV